MTKALASFITLIIFTLLLCGFTSYKSTSVLPKKLEEGKVRKFT